MRGVSSPKTRLTRRTEAQSTTDEQAITDGWSPCAGACLTEEQVLGFVEGKLNRRDIECVDSHLNACTSCGALIVEALQAGIGRLPSEHAARSGCWSFGPGSSVAGRYAISRTLGRGGMGEVYEAVDLELQRPVALKTTRVAKSDQAEGTEQLRAEFMLARRVCHPHVCRVHEVGVHQDEGPHGTPLGFLSMELINGESMARRLRGGTLHPEQVLCIARGLFAGLAAIHDAGVIHRDIKSHNLMLRAGAEPESPAIIDFGLAVNATHEFPIKPPSRGSPSAFSVEGSPAYMAPEQFRDALITPAADIFAGGVVLFEALTGTLPFRSLRPEKRRAWRDPEEVPARVGELTPNLPQRLERFVTRCLEIDCARRYTSARQALSDLDR
jgi:eukaryotic-like serine/threonine-protein kinase